jgi:Arabinose efflux permease
VYNDRGTISMGQRGKIMQQKLWTKQYISALFVLFGICMGVTTVLAILPIFAKNLSGLDVHAGLMISLFALTALSMRFVSGRIVENFGCKKVILGGLFLTLLSAILYINCERIFLALLYRAMQGIGFGISQTAISTYISKICPPSSLMEGINYAAIVASFANVLVPPLSFILIGKDLDQFKAVFSVAVVIALITIIIMIFSKDVKLTVKSEPKGERGTAKEWLLLALPAVVLFLNCLSQSAITSFISLYAISLGFTNAGAFFSINAIGMICSRFIISKLAKKYGIFHLVVVNSALFGISLFFIANVTSSWQLLALALPAGFSMGAVAPIVNVFMLRKIPKNRDGIANALYYSAMDVGYGVGSFIWGLLATVVGYANLFFIAAVIQILCITLGIIQIKKFKTK